MATYPSLTDVLAMWTFEPTVVLGLVITALVYFLGLQELHRRGKIGSLVKTRHIVWFALGLLAIAVALLSPIDALSLQLFAVHMFQHMLLLVIAPPLLLMGKPVPVLLVGLPLPLVRAVARAHHRSRVFKGVVALLTGPVLTWLLFNGLTVFWHLPALYQAALASPSVHLLEHLCFLISGMLFWWVMLEPFPGPPRLGYAWRVLYAFGAMLPGAGLGLLFVFATKPVYPAYAALPRLWGISAINDQSAAGIVMWMVGDTILLAGAFWCFVQLMERYERRVRANDAFLEGELARYAEQDAIEVSQGLQGNGA